MAPSDLDSRVRAAAFEFHGARIRVPRSAGLRPNREFLAERYEWFKKAVSRNRSCARAWLERRIGFMKTSLQHGALTLARQCAETDTLRLKEVLRLRLGGQRGDSNKPMGAGRAGPPRVPPDFPFHQEWHGIVYATKQIRPIFVDEPEEIVVVTVYVYYLLEERR